MFKPKPPKSKISTWLKSLGNKLPPIRQLEIDFLASLSHEVRTPLNGIVGTLGLLTKTQLSERQQKYVETIRKGSDQLMEVMNKVLDILKIDIGQLTLEPDAFDIAAATNIAVESIAAACHQKGIELLVRHQPNLHTHVLADHERYQQVITSLLTNAATFTGKGHIFLNLSQPRLSPDGKSALYRVEIEDTGSGIPATQLQAMLQQLAQPQLSSYHRHPSIGLGLAHANGLLRLMNGKLHLSSQENQGTTAVVDFIFPLAEPETIASPLPDLPSLNSQRALLVCPNARSRRLTHEMLAANGIQVEECESAEKAIAKLKSGRPFNMVLADTQVDDPSSLAKKAPLLIALAENGDGDRANHFEKLGFHAFLPKPHTMKELSTILALAQLRKTGNQNTLSSGIITREYLYRLSLQDASGTPQSMAKLGEVLVVEDDILNQRVMQAILTRLGANTTIAANGLEGTEIFLSGSYNLVFMDMNMPFMDGPETAALIRKIENQRGKKPVPIVALTANVLTSDKNACLAAGMNDFLTKPVTVEKMKAMMEKWLRT